MIKNKKICILSLIPLLLSGCQAAVLNPKGVIAVAERNILITALILMLLIVIPVIILTFYFAWRYRASNTKAVYKPNWANSHVIEAVCWIIPCIIIGILAIITWITAHTLDPYKPLNTEKKHLTIQVVSLNWKWLFIYPDQNIATVNYLQVPVDQPVRFLITADGPMNSFSIPQLAGQIYAMAGMRTKLHMMATHLGTYDGLAFSFSGEGFSDMKFKVKVTTKEAFNHWVTQVAQTAPPLTQATFTDLRKESIKNPVELFSSPKPNLFNQLMMEYMGADMMKMMDSGSTTGDQQQSMSAMHHMSHMDNTDNRNKMDNMKDMDHEDEAPSLATPTKEEDNSQH